MKQKILKTVLLNLFILLPSCSDSPSFEPQPQLDHNILIDSSPLVFEELKIEDSLYNTGQYRLRFQAAELCIFIDIDQNIEYYIQWQYEYSFGENIISFTSGLDFFPNSVNPLHFDGNYTWKIDEQSHHLFTSKSSASNKAITFILNKADCSQPLAVNNELGWFPIQDGNYWKSYDSHIDFAYDPYKVEILNIRNIFIDDLNENLIAAVLKEGPAESLGPYSTYILGVSADGNRIYSFTPFDMTLEFSNIILDSSNVILLVNFPSGSNSDTLDYFKKGLGPLNYPIRPGNNNSGKWGEFDEIRIDGVIYRKCNHW